MKQTLLILTLAIGVSGVSAQSIDNILTAPWFGLSGGVNASVSANIGETYNQPPLSYMLNASLSPTVKGFGFPLSMSYSNRKVNYAYSQPFNNFEFAPSYKWFKAYIGSASMNFSPLTMSGYKFTGAGVELTPSAIPFKFSAMYGRLRKAYVSDSSETDIAGQETGFARNAFATRMNYNVKKFDVGLILFKAKDNAHSLPQDYGIAAKENLALELSTTVRLLPELKLDALYARCIDEDVSSDKVKPNNLGNYLTNVLQPNTATTHTYNSNSYKMTLSLKWFGLTYERTDPNYQTFGTYTLTMILRILHSTIIKR
ncbi:hypothetical protein FACS1894201_08060 [Bacteroidia bacterium]|nr:hypothetical protein FACS1894201_08060 [Bacteroidia bacterium]